MKILISRKIAQEFQRKYAFNNLPTLKVNIVIAQSKMSGKPDFIIGKINNNQYYLEEVV